jgi:hypothetical protein
MEWCDEPVAVGSCRVRVACRVESDTCTLHRGEFQKALINVASAESPDDG